ncbi:hypothetical protein [Salipiger mucosus]|uniref:Deoxynucleotide monophosphate kinase n=1 Tax=Salipiger mucosus DSM 16094 TaxID=1123237 RepID=S9QWP1_9RHOB|nr:hypothetical protein [Salipiger mucosus]EPX84023.1 hypothetical protein Salmuc_01798 [Salipiger mucosus DSM 16094]
MQQLVMFNGPPRAGKDTAGEICRSLIGDMAHADFVKFTTSIKNAAHQELGLAGDAHAFEDLKDTPLSEFRGMSPREFYIDKSERLRAEHGYDIVARLLVRSLETVDADIVVNTDLGMDYEADHLIRHFGAENTTLVRIHRDGHTFDDDCREFVYRDDVDSFDVSNTSFEDFERCVDPILDTVLQRVRAHQVQPA